MVDNSSLISSKRLARALEALCSTVLCSLLRENKLFMFFKSVIS